MKRIYLFACFLISTRIATFAQWNEQMYSQYTHNNYTTFEAFNRPIQAENYDAVLLEAAILFETNRQRVDYGLSPLKYDYALHICARNHSVDMVNYDFFSHTSVVPGKERMADRLAEMGYRNCWCAENILYSPVKESYATTARFLVENVWMNSEGHRKNILNAKYTHLGAGIAFYYKDGWLMVKATQNFLCKK
jgi:uncharacterized protein YkwD